MPKMVIEVPEQEFFPFAGQEPLDRTGCLLVRYLARFLDGPSQEVHCATRQSRPSNSLPRLPDGTSFIWG